MGGGGHIKPETMSTLRVKLQLKLYSEQPSAAFVGASATANGNGNSNAVLRTRNLLAASHRRESRDLQNLTTLAPDHHGMRKVSASSSSSDANHHSSAPFSPSEKRKTAARKTSRIVEEEASDNKSSGTGEEKNDAANVAVSPNGYFSPPIFYMATSSCSPCQVTADRVAESQSGSISALSSQSGVTVPNNTREKLNQPLGGEVLTGQSAALDQVLSQLDSAVNSSSSEASQAQELADLKIVLGNADSSSITSKSQSSTATASNSSHSNSNKNSEGQQSSAAAAGSTSTASSSASSDSKDQSVLSSCSRTVICAEGPAAAARSKRQAAADAARVAQAFSTGHSETLSSSLTLSPMNVSRSREEATSATSRAESISRLSNRDNAATSVAVPESTTSSVPLHPKNDNSYHGEDDFKDDSQQQQQQEDALLRTTSSTILHFPDAHMTLSSSLLSSSARLETGLAWFADSTSPSHHPPGHPLSSVSSSILRSSSVTTPSRYIQQYVTAIAKSGKQEKPPAPPVPNPGVPSPSPGPWPSHSPFKNRLNRFLGSSPKTPSQKTAMQAPAVPAPAPDPVHSSVSVCNPHATIAMAGAAQVAQGSMHTPLNARNSSFVAGQGAGQGGMGPGAGSGDVMSPSVQLMLELSRQLDQALQDRMDLEQLLQQREVRMDRMQAQINKVEDRLIAIELNGG